MSSIEMHNTARTGRGVVYTLAELAITGASRVVSAGRNYIQRRRDRAAFLNLLGKEEWLYRDMGIHSGDVEWAARLPLHVNAAEELEKLRVRNNYGR